MTFGKMSLKEKILALIEEVNVRFLAPALARIGETIGRIGSGVGNVSHQIQVYYGHFSLWHARTVEHLDKLYKHLPKQVQEDEGVKSVYEARKKELEAEGYLTPKDLILSPLGKGLDKSHRR